MNPIAFFDTETTGLPQFKEPSEDPRQPHIVQLAALLVDQDTRRTLATLDVVIKPEGWTIPDDGAAIHGITTEYANAVGVPEPLAVTMLLAMLTGRTRVAHNETFDARIVRIALKRFATDAVADEWKAADAICTASLATPIVNLPPTEKMLRAGFKKPKTPNLGEAYRHFFGRDFEGAHSALGDVQACRDIYFAIQDARQPAAEPA